MSNGRRSGKSLLPILIAGAIFLTALAAGGFWLVRSFLGEGERTVALPTETTPSIAVAGGPVGNTVVIGGIVHDESGEPLPGVNVRVGWTVNVPAPPPATGTARQGVTRSATTDSDGHWHVNGVPSDSLKEFAISVTRAQFITQRLSNPTTRPLLDQTANYVLLRGTTLSGMIVDEAGQPVAGAKISNRRSNYDSAAIAASSDSLGHFTLRTLPPGPIILTVTAPGYAPEQRTVAPADQSTPVQVALSPGKTLKARVVDPDGRAIGGADVSVEFWREGQTLNFTAQTDSAGRFKMTDAPADEMLFSIDKEGYQDIQPALTAGGSEQTITLSPVVIASGRVVDAKTGEPIPKFNVISGGLWPTWSWPNFDYSQGKPFMDGTYSLALSGYSGAVASWYVRIEAPGYAPAVSAPLIASGALPDFRLAAASDIAGRVLKPDGSPAAGATVNMARYGEQVFFTSTTLLGTHDRGKTATTDAQGTFHFPPEIGEVEFTAAGDAGFATLRRDAADQSAIELKLRPWAKVVVHGLQWNTNDESHFPFAQIAAASDPMEEWVFDRWSLPMTAEGEDFAIERVPVLGDGMLTLTIGRQTPQYEAGPLAAVQMAPGQTKRLDFSDGVTVGGRLVPRTEADRLTNYSVRIIFQAVVDKPPGQWPADWAAAAKLLPEFASCSVNTVDARGRFTFPHMRPGKYECYAYLDNMAWATASSIVEIGPGKSVDLGDLTYTRQSPAKIGDPAPVELAIGMDGRPISTADFVGKIVVVAFWWSIPGDLEQRKLVDLGAKISKRANVALLAINDDQIFDPAPRRPPEIGDGWITSTRPGFPSNWGNQGQFVIIGADGKIAAEDVAADQVEATLDKMK